MVRHLIGIAILFTAFTAVAQKNQFTPPDYKKISKAISKPGTEFYYPLLMERYRENDTTLTPHEYYLLYYGYTLQPGYAPYGHLPLVDSLMTILHDKQLLPGQYDKAATLCNAILDKNPFDLRFLDPLIYVYRMQGKNDLASRLEFRLGRIVETIFSTGDGLSEKTAFHVIAISHEYDMLRALGFGFAGEQSLTRNQCDYLKVARNDYGIDGMYFNVSALLKTMN